MTEDVKVNWGGVLAIVMFGFFAATIKANGDGNVDSNPYFELSADEKVQLITNLGAINLGDSWDKAKNILGDPDLEYEVGPKESHSMTGVERVYFVYRQSHLSNINDQKAVLLFRDGSIIYIYSNINGYIREEGEIN